MKKLLSIYAFLYALTAWAGLPIPKDQNNTPMYNSQSSPYFATPATITTSSYVDIYTLPNSGLDFNRIWKHVVVRNPDNTRIVYICFGSNFSCSTDMMKVPATLGLALDDIAIGFINGVTDIWARLDSGGSVTPEITIW